MPQSTKFMAGGRELKGSFMGVKLKVAGWLALGAVAGALATMQLEATARNIHIAGHRANPRHLCLLHTHMPWATSLTMIEGGRLEMAHQTAARFSDAGIVPFGCLQKVLSPPDIGEKFSC